MNVRAGRGSAVLLVLLLLTLFSAIALGAAAVVRVELLLAARHQLSVEARYAAEAALEVATAELRSVTDWSAVVAGARTSSRSAGAFGTATGLPGGGSLLLCCGPTSAAGRLDAETAAASVPARRAAVWRPFLWTPLHAVAPRSVPSRLYVVVWVANDEADAAGGAGADTNDTLMLHAEGLSVGSTRRAIEARVARPPPPGGEEEDPGAADLRRRRVTTVTWREVR